MAKALLFILLLMGLAAVFMRVIEWFEINKGINILPSTLIEMIAVIVFLFTYGSTDTSKELLMWASVITVIIITIWNLIRYGVLDGLLVSLAELFFSASAAVLIICIFIASDQEKPNKRSSRRKG